MASPSSAGSNGRAGPAVTVANIGAAALPSLLAFNIAPSPTLLNQALATTMWGLFVCALAVAARGDDAWFELERATRRAWALLVSLALVGAAAALSSTVLHLPASLGLSALGMLAGAAALALSGARTGAAPDARSMFSAFCLGWLACGLLNTAIALVQVFQPAWADGGWIAASGIPGRAVGNLRQPNHLSSLLMWATIATVALVGMRRLPRSLGFGLAALFVFAVVLTASRTGLVSVLLLALWGAADFRMPRAVRAMLVATPFVYGLGWLGMAQWARASAHAFGGAARLAEGDISSSRFAIWSDTLALIAREPWFGVGFGEFNLAWSLTPFPNRPTAFFDHTHNLPLQLAVELGVPLAMLICGLLLWGLWRAARDTWRSDPAQAMPARAAVAMVVMIGLHSLLEYPLWYAYFLLPAAWAFGFALASHAAERADPGAVHAADAVPSRAATDRDEPSRAEGNRPLFIAGLLLAIGGALAVVDYARVAVIFAAPEGAAPLDERIEKGRDSVLFAHHAEYAAATVADDPSTAMAAFRRAPHYLMDTRLTIAWAEALAATGRLDEARHLAARLREFRNPASDTFFAVCEDPGVKPRPFQCEPPTREVGWREFLR